LRGGGKKKKKKEGKCAHTIWEKKAEGESVNALFIQNMNLGLEVGKGKREKG